MFNTLVRNLGDFLRNTLIECSSGIIKRNRKVGILKLFDAMSFQLQQKSYADTTAYLLHNTSVNITRSALVYRRKKLEEEFFNNVYDKIHKKYKHLLENTSTPRSDGRKLMMVDGSNITFLPTFERHGFSKSGNSKDVTRGLVTGIYNQTDDTITSLSLGKEYNERKGFLEAVKLINLNSSKAVFVFDRGYWSPEIATYLIENNHDFVFRLPCQNRHLRPLQDGTTSDYRGVFEYKERRMPAKVMNVRYLKYQIQEGGEIYYIVTTLFDNPIDEIKDIYHKRWSIEGVYKLFKDTCDIEPTKHQLPEFYSQDIAVFRILYLIQRIVHTLFNGLQKKPYKENESINSKHSMNVLINYVIAKLLHRPKGYIKKTIEQIGHMFGTAVESKPDRVFKRKAHSPSSKWYAKSRNNQKVRSASNTSATIPSDSAIT